MGEKREINYIAALKEAIAEEMRRDKTVFYMGEDVQFWGPGASGLGMYDLVNEFGKERIRNTPLSEMAIVGAGVGAAIAGMRPVAELMFSGLMQCAGDEIIHKMAKWTYQHAGQFKQFSFTLILPGGNPPGFGLGTEHGSIDVGYVLHGPLIKIAVPSTPYDLKGLVKTAIRDNNPNIIFLHRALYGLKGHVPQEEYIIPFGKAEIRRTGKDVTIFATLAMVHQALDAASELAKEGIDAEIIDPRTWRPLDKEALFNSIKKTGKLVVVDEEYKTQGPAAEIAAIVAEEMFEYLDAPIKRVCMPDIPIPASGYLDRFVIPNKDGIMNAVKEIVES
jgi:pyruvate dehydrogenase E1 component beta subunit